LLSAETVKEVETFSPTYVGLPGKLRLKECLQYLLDSGERLVLLLIQDRDHLQLRCLYVGEQPVQMQARDGRISFIKVYYLLLRYHRDQKFWVLGVGE